MDESEIEGGPMKVEQRREEGKRYTVDAKERCLSNNIQIEI